MAHPQPSLPPPVDSRHGRRLPSRSAASRRPRRTSLVIAAAAALLAGTLATTADHAASAAVSAGTAADGASQSARPTVVLIHGAFEDASAWSQVTGQLQATGYRVLAPAVPLRGIATDVEYLNSFLGTVDGPIVLVGHSYGGALISELAARNSHVSALVYVAAFVPKAGETINALNTRYPGSILGSDTTYTVDYKGGTDMYVQQGSYRQLYAGDRTAAQAAVAAAQQRPIAASVLTEKTTAQAPGGIPKFAIVATEDKAVPPRAEEFMAKRAGARICHVRSAHDVPVSHPEAVTEMVEVASSVVPGSS